MLAMLISRTKMSDIFAEKSESRISLMLVFFSSRDLEKIAVSLGSKNSTITSHYGSTHLLVFLLRLLFPSCHHAVSHSIQFKRL